MSSPSGMPSRPPIVNLIAGLRTFPHWGFGGVYGVYGRTVGHRGQTLTAPSSQHARSRESSMISTHNCRTHRHFVRATRHISSLGGKNGGGGRGLCYNEGRKGRYKSRGEESKLGATSTSMHDAKESIGTGLVPGSMLMSGVDRRTYPLDFWSRSSQTYHDDFIFWLNN